MPTPLVSICLPNLNTRPFLEERMETIFGQTFRDWELIVCDSHSDDGAWEFFEKFRDDPRVQLYQVPREGIYAGWNECLKRARGTYLHIATSDDTSHPKLLEKVLAALEPHPEVLMASCNFTCIDDQGQPFPIEARHPNAGAEIYGDWLDRPHRRHGPSEFVAACVAGPVWTTIASTLFHQSLVQPEAAGPFITGKGSIADYEWGLRASLVTDTIHVPEPLATWRIHQQQVTSAIDKPRTQLKYPEMMQSVFHACQDRIPVAVREAPAIVDRLSAYWLTRSYNYLKLYPGMALKTPLRYAAGLAFALRHHPVTFLRHHVRGGRWKYRPQIDLRQYVSDLLSEFNLPPICSAP